ncbi:hypothetical protein ACJ3XI_11230 [Litorimonas sp. RW-G-Af-16]|uniref:hypothetical protein n=1 Tax=Litorimonas sp. RW-G-Af-16 TaxID=3241168 RepID=UPI00390C8BA0
MTKMTETQIAAALDAGIISPDQAQAMRADLGQNPAPTRPSKPTDAVIGQEDNMRFLRSFSDVFIGIGLILLVLGLSGMTAMIGGGTLYLAAAAGVAVLADFFGRKKRAHFPTLILALTFLIFAQRGFGAWLGGSGTLAALVTAGVMGLFYWRIRLPFCVALIALSLLYLLFAILAETMPELTRGNLGVVLFLSGLVVFGVALIYDMQDLHRRTRFADNAFWLHFIAAPLLIHGLVIMSIKTKSDVLFGFIPMVSVSRADAGFMLVIIFILTLIGLAINRRALIVSSLGYAGFALAYLFDGVGMNFATSALSALLALGALVVFLGVGWHEARNLLIKVLPKWRIFPPPFEEQTPS